MKGQSKLVDMGRVSLRTQYRSEKVRLAILACRMKRLAVSGKKSNLVKPGRWGS